MPTLRARDSVGRNASAVFAGQVLTWLTTAITFALIPRYLGAHDVGVYAIGVTFWTLATAIAGLGMGTLITRDVARDREGASRIVATAIWVNLALGLIAGTAAVALAWLVGYSRETLLVVAMLAATVPLSLIGGVVGSILTGLEIMRWNAIFDVATKVLFLIGAVVALVLDSGIVGVVTASAACSVIVFIVQLKVLHGIVGVRQWRLRKDTTNYLLVKSIPFFLVSITWVLYASIDILLLSLLAESVSVGLYATPMRILGTALFIPVTITTVLFPRLSADYLQDRLEMTALSARVMKLVTASSFAITIASIALSDDFFVGLLGQSFSGKSGPIIVVLSISIIPTSMSIVAGRIAFAADRQRAVSFIGLAALLGRAVLGISLIPLFDAKFDNPALGAAVTLVLAEGAMTVAMLRFLPTGTFGAESRQFYRRVGIAAGLACVACASAYGISAIVASLVALASYGFILVVLGVCAPKEMLLVAGSFTSRYRRAGASG